MVYFRNIDRGLCNFICEFLFFYSQNFNKLIKINTKEEDAEKGNNFNILFKNNKVKPNSKFQNTKIDIFFKFRLFWLDENIKKIYKYGLKQLLVKDNILSYVDNFSNYFNENTVSVHIRTWDSETNTKTNNSHAKRRRKLFTLDTYIYYMNKLIKESNDEVNFFISCDNSKYNQQLIEIFGNKIIFYQESKDLSWKENDMASLLLLSKNKIFIATYQSTFSQIAYLYNDNIETLIYGDEIKKSSGRPNPINPVDINNSTD
jgi:hypothetical protein